MNLAAGQSLIITGASRGIGRALAQAVAAEGLHLALNARTAGTLEETAELCRAQGVQARAVAGSAADHALCRRLVDQARELGELAGFVHAAGVLHPGPWLWEITPEQAAEVMEASFFGALALMRAAVPPLRQAGRGVAVLFGSGAAEMHIPGLGVYSAAKAGAEFLAAQLAAEAPELTAFAFRPGMADTRMQADARQAGGGAGEELRRRFSQYRDQGALRSPAEAARALVAALTGSRPLAGQVVSASRVLD
jgi:NAD(P)-dependent dehydrogenase (short-subunit alcohol dehydrogenase family)